jgi:nucleoside-diphosphate-sugar epimerase
MRILITGATGFIGKHLINFLIELKFELICLRRKTSDISNIDSRVTWIEKGISQFEKSDFDKIDVIIHLAAVGVSPQKGSWEECMQFNFIESSSFIELALESNVAKVIVAGTFAEYGKTAEKKLYLDVDDSLMPIGAYATSKALLFYKLKEIHKSAASDIIYLRLFSVYGEGQFEKNLWPQLKKAAQNGSDIDLTLGLQIRDFIDVESVCEKIRDEVLRENYKNFSVLNIGTGKGSSVREFALFWWSKFNATGKINFGALNSRPGEIFRMVSKQY